MAYFISKQAAAQKQAAIRQALLDSCRYVSDLAPLSEDDGNPITIPDDVYVTLEISGRGLRTLREAIAQAIKNPESTR